MRHTTSLIGIGLLALVLSLPAVGVLAQGRQGGPRGQAPTATTAAPPPASGGPMMRGQGGGMRGQGGMQGQGQMRGRMMSQGQAVPRPPMHRPAGPGYGPGYGRGYYGRPVPPPVYRSGHTPWYWGETPTLGYPYYPGYPGLSVNGYMGYGPVALNFAWLHSTSSTNEADADVNVGKVKFVIEPKSAIILVDGLYVGEARDLGNGIKLTAGEHLIQVIVGDVQREFKIAVLPGQTTLVRLTQ